MFDFSLPGSIRTCQRITREAHSSFAPAFALLPKNKREAMEILYAYNRFTDDLVDGPDSVPDSAAGSVDPAEKREKLNQWAEALEIVLGTIGGDPSPIESAGDEQAFRFLEERFPDCSGLSILPALRMIVDQFRIPREPLFHLIDGVESDIEPRTFETFEDCAEYCHQVATSVGFASLAVWETTEPLFSDPVVHAAKACGIAFQWTNILRDLLEDYQGGRIYLPESELQRAGLTANQFGSLLDRKHWNQQKKKPDDPASFDPYSYSDMIRQMNVFEERFDLLLLKQFQRCEVYYTNAAPLYDLIHPDSRRVFGMMWDRYYALYRKIRSRPLQITRGRVSLSILKKFRILLRWRFLPKRKLLVRKPGEI